MFDHERDQFKTFRDAFAAKAEVRAALEESIRTIYHDYDTTVNENRFTVGGAVEFVVGAALRACGILVQHRGLRAVDVDLVFEDVKAGYSVKALFKTDQTNLLNVLGKPPVISDWQTGTLFVVGGGPAGRRRRDQVDLIPVGVAVGIVYSDPDLPWWRDHITEYVKPTSGALQVHRRGIIDFARTSPEWVAPCSLPGKEAGMPRKSFRTASMDIAAQVLMHHKVLFDHFPALNPSEQK
jgi:hypothetical protein